MFYIELPGHSEIANYNYNAAKTMPIDVYLVIDELSLPNHPQLEFTDYNPFDMPRTMGSEYRHRVIRIDVTVMSHFTHLNMRFTDFLALFMRS